jgi:hypothetical protein
MKLWKFKAEMFSEGLIAPAGWHLVNDAAGQQGEFTLCGIAFDGDATRYTSSEVEEKATGKVTCPKCIAIIKLCKSVML